MFTVVVIHSKYLLQPYEDEAAAVTQKRIEEYCERHPEYIKTLEAQREGKTVKKKTEKKEAEKKPKKKTEKAKKKIA